MIENYDSIKVSDLINKIPARFKLTMMCSAIFSLLAYAYIYLNPIFTYDGASYSCGFRGAEDLLAGATRMTPLAQFWFSFQGGAQVPWLAGVMSMCLYGWASYFVCEALEIKSNFFVVLLTGLMIINPAIICSQMYGAGGLMFAFCLFFASISAWLAYSDNKYSWLLFMIIFLITIATYSSYICWTAVIFLIRQIRDLVQDHKPVRKVLLRDLIVSLGSSLCLAIDIIFCIILMRVKNGTFQGRVSDMLNAEPIQRGQKFMHGIEVLVKELLPIKFVNEKMGGGDISFYSIVSNHKVIALLLYASYFFMIILLLRHMVRKAMPATAYVLVAVHIILAFISMGAFLFVYREHGLMIYAHFAPWIMLLTMCDTLRAEKESIWHWCGIATRGLTAALAVCTIVLCTLIANVGYMRNEALFQTATLLMERVVDRLENIDGYKHGQTPVYFIGDVYDYAFPPFTPFMLSEGLTGGGTTDSYTSELRLGDLYKRTDWH